MILKLIVFAVAGYFIYKILGGKLPSIGKSKEQRELDEDTLVECEKCSTYVTVKESVIIGGKYYCDDCASKV